MTRATMCRDRSAWPCADSASLISRGGASPLLTKTRQYGSSLMERFTTTRNCDPNLSRKGHRFRTQSDTEVIVHLYEEMGKDCVTRLNGMFAFALWDSKQRLLFLARDRLGIKPLFYSYEPGQAFYFASEIKAILTTAVSRRPDYQALYDYLSLMYVPTPATAFAAIRKLPPACVLTCSPDGLAINEVLGHPAPGEWRRGIGKQRL